MYPLLLNENIFVIMVIILCRRSYERFYSEISVLAEDDEENYDEGEPQSINVDEPKTDKRSRISMTPEELLQECLHGFNKEHGGRFSSFLTSDSFMRIGGSIQFCNSHEDDPNEVTTSTKTKDDDYEFDDDDDVDCTDDDHDGEELVEKLVLPKDWKTMKKSNLFKFLNEKNPLFNLADNLTEKNRASALVPSGHEADCDQTERLLLPSDWKTMKQSDLHKYLNIQKPSFNLPEVAEEVESSHVSKVIVLPKNWTNLSEDELHVNIVKSNPKEVEQQLKEIFTRNKEHDEMSVGISSSGNKPFKLPRNWRDMSKKDLENKIKTASIKMKDRQGQGVANGQYGDSSKSQERGRLLLAEKEVDTSAEVKDEFEDIR